VTQTAEGYQIAADAVFAELQDLISAPGLFGNKVFVTGHSLGGALATLSAHQIVSNRVAEVTAVYTFGMPRAGTEVFANTQYNPRLGSCTYRLVQGDDLVPTLAPTELGFHHLGRYLHCLRDAKFEARVLAPNTGSDDPQFVAGAGKELTNLLHGPTIRSGSSSVAVSNFRMRPGRSPNGGRMTAPSATQAGPQYFARPVRQPQFRGASGQRGYPPLQGVMRHTLPPANQAAAAFALSGHRPGSAQILRNQFFADRPALAHASFRGRLTQFASRDRHRFLPVIVIGFIGPLFWPYAYNDFLNYTFYAYAYDTFWPAAYDDVYGGLTGVYESGVGPGYAATGSQPVYQSSAELSSGLCADQTAGATDWHRRDCTKRRAG
jgi:hypothetical protein